MKVDERFIEAVSRIVESGLPHQLVIGSVKSLDQGNDTCTVERDDAPKLFKVRLNAVLDDIANKTVVYPAVGSKVLCAIIGNDKKEATIIKYSEIDSVATKIGDTNYLVDTNGYKIQRGDNNLKQLLNDVISEIQKIIVVQGTSPDVAALEEIKEKINKVLQ